MKIRKLCEHVWIWVQVEEWYYEADVLFKNWWLSGGRDCHDIVDRFWRCSKCGLKLSKQERIEAESGQ